MPLCPLFLRYPVLKSRKNLSMMLDVVGPLRLNGDLTLWRVHLDRIGEEFLPVLVDLLEHLLVVPVGGAFRVNGKSLPEGTHVALNRFHIGVYPVSIQSQ